MKRYFEMLRKYQSFLGVILIFMVGVAVCHNGSYDRERQRYYNTFLTKENQTNVLRQVSVKGILAVGMTLVILTAGIDLSVGAVLALSGVVAADLLRYQGLPVVLVIPLTLLVGASCGLGSGFLVTKCRLQPFIATLAMMSIARGMAQYWGAWSNRSGQLIGLSPFLTTSEGVTEFTNIKHFLRIAADIGGGLKFQSVIFITVILVGVFVLNKTRFGRYIYAIGGNEEAARLSGIAVDRVKLWVYVIAGGLSALAGMVDAANLNSGNPASAYGYELDAIAAVVIGGTSLMGGVGTMTGTLLGALIMGFIDNIMGLKNIDTNLQMIFKGIIIVTAVMLQRTKK